MEFNQFTRAAIRAAVAGGDVLSHYFNRNIKVDYKGRIDPVTEADRTSQRAIAGLLIKKFPKHTVLGEEEEAKAAVCSEYCWIVDPLDGTVNFIHNLPIFCVSVALMHEGEIVSGVIHAPLLKETFIAEKGKGVFYNGKRVKVSPVDDLVRSLVVTGFPYDVHTKAAKVLDQFKRIIVEVQGVRRIGSAALDLAYVSMGRYEAFWEQGLAPWDVAAGALMVRESGGKITDYSGGDEYLFGKSLVATNGRVHESMMKLIRARR